MSRFPRQFLAFSIISFLLFSCQTHKLIWEEEQPGPDISAPLQLEKGDRAIYKANLEVFRNNISGVFVILNADSLYKVGFVSEMGVKFFDMKIDEDGYEVVYCMEAINRKPLLNSIVRSLQYILEDPGKHDGSFYATKSNDTIYKLTDNDGWKRKYFIENGRVKRIEGKKLLRNRVFVNAVYNNKNQPENIIFLQRGIRMRIEMNKL